MDLTKASAELKLPPVIDEAWNRLLNKGGTRSDLKSVLAYLAKLWPFEEHDPQRFKDFLLEHGVLANAPPSMLSEFKQRFEREQRAKVRPTRELIEALMLGPHSCEFFASSTELSSELKLLAYRTAIADYCNEGIVFALSALSQESRYIVEEAIKPLPNSPVLDTFSEYLKGARLPLAFADGRQSETPDNEIPVDHLFRLATIPLKDMVERFRDTRGDEGASLLHLAEILMERLPGRGFGHFVKLNISVFICVAAPESNSFDLAKQTLIGTGEPSVVDVLGVIGREQVLAELRDSRNTRPSRERFLAALIDGWRRLSAASDQFRKEIEPFVSVKAGVVALAVSAGLTNDEPKNKAKFEKFLLRSLQNDKGESVREWLIRNPEFINHLRTAKASIPTLRAILDTYRTKKPAQALRVITQVLGERSGHEPQRYWEEAIRALASIGGDEADRVFSWFLLERIQRGEELQIRDMMAREPSRSLLRQNIWSLLAKTTKEQDWAVLFNIYGTHTTAPELVRLLESAHGSNARLAAWISKILLPELLENGLISPSFHRSIANPEIVAIVAKELARRALEDVRWLQGVAKDWPLTTAGIKNKLGSSILNGVRIGLRNAVPGTNLYSQLSKVLSIGEDWITVNSPKLDPSIESLATANLPNEISPDQGSVQQIFRQQAPGSNDFTLIAGMNPWLLDMILGPEPGPWPKPELLLDQVTQKFIQIALLRKRAEQGLRNLSQMVKIELAVAFRDVLSDIESDIAGYFIFRDILKQNGLDPVMERLGSVIEQKELSSQKHKLIRDPVRRGRLRVFGLGIRVDDRVIGSGLIMNSGDDDDRD